MSEDTEGVTKTEVPAKARYVGLTKADFALRNAVKNFVFGSPTIYAQTVRWFAACSVTSPRANYLAAHKAFVSFANRLNAGIPFTEESRKYCDELLNQHLDIIIKLYKNERIVRMIAKELDVSEVVEDEAVVAEIVKTPKDDLPF